MALRCAMSPASRIVRITDWMRSPRVYRCLQHGQATPPIGEFARRDDERTVATIVGHILDKLGFKSRAQIAGWISSDR